LYNVAIHDRKHITAKMMSMLKLENAEEEKRSAENRALECPRQATVDLLAIAARLKAQPRSSVNVSGKSTVTCPP
jgi:hypothetical protein